MLVAELKAEFEPRGWIISASVSPSAAVIDQGYDVASLTKNLDMLIVSSYDYHGNWDGRTGHVAPLYTHSKTRSEAVNNNVNYTVHYLLSLGAEKKKMVVGMPFYGNTFQLRDLNDTGLDAPSMGPGKPGRFSRTGGFLPYYEVSLEPLSSYPNYFQMINFLSVTTSKREDLTKRTLSSSP